jgi:hypothetical protein
MIYLPFPWLGLSKSLLFFNFAIAIDNELPAPASLGLIELTI